MRLIPVIGAAFLAACPAFAQPAPEWAPNGPGGVPPAPLNNASAPFAMQPALPLFAVPRDTCAGGSEQALRHQIETMAAGQPDYDAMAPRVADQWRPQVEKLAPVTRQWGALISLKGSASRRGLFEARFEHARLRWEIACQDGKKITGISFRTLS